MAIPFILGFILSFIVAFLAYKKHSLNQSGFITATLLGTVIYGFGTFVAWGSLILFFISSSLLTKLHEKKTKDASSGRNYIQVLSNGLIAAIFSVLYYFLKNELLLIAAIISISSCNSDTWASEIGVLSKGKTYSILTFKEVEKGVSGGVSKLGTAASFFGALFIAVSFVLLYSVSPLFDFTKIVTYFTVITIGGFIGCLVDSYMGILLQAKYKGERTGTYTEKPFLENEKVILINGLSWITNDAVNFISGFVSTAVSMLVLII
jgi:uncharacterized protein (TIGR00297 family)